MVDAEQVGAIVAEVVEAYFAAKNRGQGSRLSPGAVPAFPPPADKPGEGRDFPAHAEKQGLEAVNPELLGRMKNSTSARIGVGKTGPRLRTGTLLKLRSDHAAARDAVFRDVSPELLNRLGMPVVQSRCGSRQEHITRPDLGRRFSDEAVKTISAYGEKDRDVQVIVSDGLSSRAVEANLENLYLVLADGLRGKHISLGPPFFVRFGRVAIEDEAAELLKARVVCILIGERPGLATAESMSAYLCYDARVGQSESRRTVVSNIHAQGIPAAEAGAYLVDLIEKILQSKASGVDFKR
ncbi:MAG: ethanolamine ammonia-lyase subunit EutC [Spirochaetaceae bacterium]|jgi:ethanolamine ammonia-lyase small subunit|nr:ethanolamine ammonia-lyase subunit EutC [Spirochaetaceae bacterium]